MAAPNERDWGQSAARSSLLAAPADQGAPTSIGVVVSPAIKTTNSAAILLLQYLAWPGARCGRRPWAAVARFLSPLPLHLSPRRQRVRAALGGGRKKRRFGMAECRVTIWPYFWLICPPCPLDHPNSTPKFRGWRKAGASTFFLFQEGLVTRHPSDLVLVVQRSRLLPSSLLWV